MTDQGETQLASLLKGMKPVLQPESFVFATLPTGSEASLLATLPAGVLRGMFHEDEGTTLILPLQAARQAGLVHSAARRQITLTIHSSLEAVGLTAAISSALSQQGISANVVAAYYHDHVFVPEADAARALAVLERLSQARAFPANTGSPERL